MDILIVEWTEKPKKKWDNPRKLGLYHRSDGKVSGRSYYVSSNPAIMRDWVTDEEAINLASAHRSQYASA